MVQVDNEKLFLRVKFKKVGRLRYISHLDLVRTMHKIIVRSRLPLKYTEGFNPKPKMVFAAPLSIGTESFAEFMDVRLSERIEPEVAMKALNSNMTEEMQVYEAYYPESKFTDLKWLSYTVTVNTSGACAELADKCKEVLLGESVCVLKKTKSGEKTVDIRPLIHSVDTSFDGKEIIIKAVLSADPSSFLNPEYLIDALRASLGVLSSENLTSEYYNIVRERGYFADMSEFR